MILQGSSCNLLDHVSLQTGRVRIRIRHDACVGETVLPGSTSPGMIPNTFSAFARWLWVVTFSWTFLGIDEWSTSLYKQRPPLKPGKSFLHERPLSSRYRILPFRTTLNPKASLQFFSFAIFFARICRAGAIYEDLPSVGSVS